MGRMLNRRRRLVDRRTTGRLALLMGIGMALLIEGLAALAAEEVAHPE